MLLLLFGVPSLVLRFDVVREEALWHTLLIVVGYALPVVFGYVKFGRLTSYHTVGARVAAVLLVAGFLSLLLIADRRLLTVAVIVHGCASVEEMCISRTLREWKSSVPSWRALRMTTHPSVPSARS